MKSGQRLVIPVENVGTGPALTVRGLVDVGGASVIFGEGRTLHPVEGIGAGRANAVVFTADSGDLDVQIELWARLAYEDVAGATYYTDVHFNASTQGYVASTFGPGDEGTTGFPPAGRRVSDVFPPDQWNGRNQDT